MLIGCDINPNTRALKAPEEQSIFGIYPEQSSNYS
jgi:hypothetical protein